MKRKVAVMANRGDPGCARCRGGAGASISCPTASGGYCYGTGSGDAPYGTLGSDRIYGRDGSDLVRGLGGGDSMYGGSEAGSGDKMRGGAGADLINGQGGDDLIEGGPGRDTLNTGKGSDKIDAQDGDKDTVTCLGSNDLVYYDRASKSFRVALAASSNCRRLMGSSVALRISSSATVASNFACRRRRSRDISGTVTKY